MAKRPQGGYQPSDPKSPRKPPKSGSGVSRGVSLKRLEDLEEAIVWMSGSSDFALGAKARVGFEKMILPLLKTINTDAAARRANTRWDLESENAKLKSDLEKHKRLLDDMAAVKLSPETIKEAILDVENTYRRHSVAMCGSLHEVVVWLKSRLE